MEKNDKARAVLVYQILRDESGEENRLSLKDIIGKIEKKGIQAERRAVTRDIVMLREKASAGSATIQTGVPNDTGTRTGIL